MAYVERQTFEDEEELLYRGGTPQEVKNNRNDRIDSYSMKELAAMYNLPEKYPAEPRKYPLDKRAATDRDPIRNGRAWAVGKMLASRKMKKKNKKIKTQKKKTTKSKSKRKTKR
jgi:hypothetical protein